LDDGKAIYAYEKSKQLKLKQSTAYFLKAVESVRENKQRFAEAKAKALLPTAPAGLGSVVLSEIARPEESGEE
jgi:hypothetical protein